MRPTATAPTPTPSPASELPTDVLLEIAMRAGFVTLLRCGATCKVLQRAIHAPYLLRRVCSNRDDGIVPTRLLLYLDTGTSSFSLAHPSTPDAAVSLVDDHLAPFVSRGAADLLAKYHPVTSRGGLFLLERKRGVEEMWMPSSQRLKLPPEPDMCVYDPMTGGRAFLPVPPDIPRRHCTYVLLTAAADGIGGSSNSSSFLLLAVDALGLGDLMPFRVQAVRSEWAPVACSYHPDLPKGTVPGRGSLNSPVVLDGVDGVVHWLISSAKGISSQAPV